ncbi:uncharacterized protein LOC143231526 isoform X2 [Tachypleus tridentatus]|uniref:uncharacterized protein LOC143231526 isoform X2 n=1 Tax=Tachypleus tridentatus TaxID=6853 RepID=UPI003FD01545
MTVVNKCLQRWKRRILTAITPILSADCLQLRIYIDYWNCCYDIFHPTMNYIAIAVIFGLVMLADTIIGTSYTPNEEEQIEEYRERLQQILPFAHKTVNSRVRGSHCVPQRRAPHFEYGFEL